MGKHDIPEYSVWFNMLSRCDNPNRKSFKNYGGRGIDVCARWIDFDKFYEDMGPRPSPSHCLERIDNDGNYDPGNCRWVTRLEQVNNRRVTRRVTYQGEEMALCDAVRAAGSVVHYEAAWIRISRCGWTVEDAVSTPRLFVSPNSRERRAQS